MTMGLKRGGARNQRPFRRLPLNIQELSRELGSHNGKENDRSASSTGIVIERGSESNAGRYAGLGSGVYIQSESKYDCQD